MLTYQGKELVKIKEKTGGKNQNPRNGFYLDSAGREFFIKQPSDLKELFTELFAGLLLEEFKKRGLIAECYHDSLICADCIQFEDGSYGLIQPKVKFKELYKIIHTGYPDDSDRNPLLEILWGTSYYPLLVKRDQYFGLSLALMFSLLLGDYSIHSGNVVCLSRNDEKDSEITQFARIDWGAAFRYFGNKQNNEDILSPFEYQGWFNLKGLTKGYVKNYRGIEHLFPAIAEKASLLIPQLTRPLLYEIVTTVLRKIPSDLVDAHLKKRIARYLDIASFANDDNCEAFTMDFCQLIEQRLIKISQLQVASPSQKNVSLYQSSDIDYPLEKPTNIGESGDDFSQQIQQWQIIFSNLNSDNPFDFKSLELSQLVQQFNAFLNYLLPLSTDKMAKDRQEKVEQFEESEILRCLYLLKSDATPFFSTSVTRSQEIKPVWKMLHSIINQGFNIVMTMKVLHDITQVKKEQQKPETLSFLLDALNALFISFNQSYQQVLDVLKISSVENPEVLGSSTSYL